MLSPSANLLIASLSPEARNLVTARCKQVDLPVRTELYRVEETPAYAFFLTRGMASIVTSMDDGRSAEVGAVGNEGFIGALFLIGPGLPESSCFMQLSGAGLRIRLVDLREIFRSSEEVRDRILEFVQEQALTLAQLAGCHALHDAEERLARWLLHAQDRTGSDVLDLTQEFLAMMLGARRSTVAVVAGSMQRSGLIEYRRGHVRILSRENLEAAACDCYRITRELSRNLYRAPAGRLAFTSVQSNSDHDGQPVEPPTG